MVAVTFITQFLAMGFTFYSFGFVLKPIAEELEWSRTMVTMPPLATSLTVGVLSPFLGRWLARGSIRNAMTLGCLAMGLGLLLVARATEFWQFLVIFGSLVTFGTATMSGITTQALVVNWFEEKRTMALGVSLMGVSGSGILMVHVTSALIESGGWRHAYDTYGWVCLCAIPFVWLTVISRPSERNRESGGDVKDDSPQATQPLISPRAALRERNLWVISVVSGLSFMGTTAVMTHLIPYATDIGFEASEAAWVMSALAAGAVSGKIVFGWLAERIGEQAALYVSLVSQGVGVAALILETPFAALLAIALGLGVGLGGVMPLVAALMARAFGPTEFGPMMGLMGPMMIPFQMVGAPIAAGVFDSTGSYDAAWFGFVGMLVLACAVLSQLRLVEPGEPAIAQPQA